MVSSKTTQGIIRQPRRGKNSFSDVPSTTTQRGPDVDKELVFFDGDDEIDEEESKEEMRLLDKKLRAIRKESHLCRQRTKLMSARIGQLFDQLMTLSPPPIGGDDTSLKTPSLADKRPCFRRDYRWALEQEGFAAELVWVKERYKDSLAGDKDAEYLAFTNYMQAFLNTQQPQQQAVFDTESATAYAVTQRAKPASAAKDTQHKSFELPPPSSGRLPSLPL